MALILCEVKIILGSSFEGVSKPKHATYEVQPIVISEEKNPVCNLISNTLAERSNVNHDLLCLNY